MLEHLTDFVFNHILEDLWADITEAQYVRMAAVVGFNLAFCVKWAHQTEDEPTLQSKGK